MRLWRPQGRIFPAHGCVRGNSRCDLLRTRLWVVELAIQNQGLEQAGALFPGDRRQTEAGPHPESQASQSQMLETPCALSPQAERAGLGQGKHSQWALLRSFRGL